MKHLFNLLPKSIWLISLAFLSACDSSNDNNINSPIVDETIQQGVSGGVTKGVLVGATVNAYLLAIDGTIDSNSIVASAVTDNNGLFNLSLAADHGYLLLVSSGGEFIDETDQNPVISERRKISFSATEGLKAVLPPGYDVIALTMTTHAIYEKTIREFSNDFYSVFDVNLQNFSAGLGFNPLNTLSADPNNPDPETTEAARQYALLTGGLANITNQVAISVGFPLPNYQVMLAVIEDFSDGNINGMLNAEPVSIDINEQPQFLPTGLNLDEAINRFRNNNFQSFQSTPLPIVDYTVLESTGQLNNPPTLTISGSTTSPAGDLVTLTANAVDADGTVESYLWQQIGSDPLLNLSGTNTSQLSFNAPVSASTQSASFLLTVTDDSALQATSTHTITFDPALLLTVNAGIDQQVSSDASVTLNGATSTDPYVSINSVSWTQVSGNAVSLINSNQLTGVTFAAPRVDNDTNLEFELTVTDSLGRAVTDRVIVNVLAYINLPPTISAGPDQNVDEQTLTNLNASASDIDGTISSISWSQISGTPVSLSNINILNPSFITPALVSNETLIFQLSVTDDDGATSIDNVSINVIANLAPIMSAGPDQTVDEQTLVSLAGTASDSDGTIASTVWTQTAGTIAVLSNANILTPSFTAPALTADETLTYQLVVTDNDGDSTTDSISINVIANLAPIMSAGPDQTVDEQTLVTLAGTASDSDGTIASIIWTQTAGTISALSDPNILAPNFTAPALTSDETLTYQLVVTDNDGDSTADSVSINVVANLPPVMSAGPDQTVDEQTLVTLAGTASDSDGTIATILWTQTGGTSAGLSDASILAPTFTAPNISVNETLVYQLAVTDNDGDTVIDSVSINLIANLPPVINAGTDQTVNEKVVVNLSASASDPDGSIVTIAWSQTQGTVATLSDTSILNPTFTAPDLTVDETLIYQVSVTDNDGDVSIDTVSININANESPLVNAGGDQTVNEQVRVNLSGSASDPDGSVVSQVWSQTQGTSVSLSNTLILTPFFNAPDISVDETLIFALTVTDDFGEVVVDTIAINVVANLPITLTPTPDFNVDQGKLITLNANAIDPESGPINLVWIQLTGPIVEVNSNFTDSISFSTPPVDNSEILSFLIEANDDIGNVTTALINVTVDNLANLPPIVSPLSYRGYKTGDAASINAFATDPEQGVLTYLWEQIGGTAVTLAGETTANLSFTAPAVLPAPEFLQFRLTVTDDSLGETVVYQKTVIEPTPVLVSTVAASLADSGFQGCLAETVTYVHELFDINCFSNGVNDIAGIEQFTYLKAVDFRGNNISDITPLNSLLYLEKVGLDNNPITNHNLLTNVSIKSLQLSNTGITDTNFLLPLIHLLDVEIGNNGGVNDLAPLAPRLGLQSLNINNTSVSDLSLISSFKAMYSLSLNNLGLSDISLVTNLPQLKNLYISNNTITDLSSLSGLTKLKIFEAANNGLSDISPLNALTKLDIINLSQNVISDTTVVSNFTLATNINFSDNLLATDLTEFYGLFLLGYLDLSINPNLVCIDVNNLNTTLASNPITIIMPIQCSG